MILILLASILGGGTTVALLWNSSILLAFVSAPFGASASALLAASCLALLRLRVAQHEHEMDDRTDRMVASLRGVGAGSTMFDLSSPASDRETRKAG